MDGQQCKQPTGMMVAIVDMVVFSGLAARTHAPHDKPARGSALLAGQLRRGRPKDRNLLFVNETYTVLFQLFPVRPRPPTATFFTSLRIYRTVSDGKGRNIFIFRKPAFFPLFAEFRHHVPAGAGGSARHDKNDVGVFALHGPPQGRTVFRRFREIVPPRAGNGPGPSPWPAGCCTRISM